MTTKHVLITGRVQGVWFRAWAQERAQELGAAGWVRNRSDGSVEALISSHPEAVEALIAAFHEGPPAAKVENVLVTEAEPPTEPGFHISS